MLQRYEKWEGTDAGTACAFRNGCKNLQVKISPTVDAIKSVFSSSVLLIDKQCSAPVRPYVFIPRAQRISKSNY